MKRAHEQEERAIREYVLAESPAGEIVRSAEKIKTESIGDRHYDIWDVRTRRHRWWVITNLTNLYSQRDYPTVDAAFSLHLGLMERLLNRDQPRGTKEERERFAGAWRRWSQASEALSEAGEAEDFQAIGVRCREALLSFLHDVSATAMVPEGQEPPKRSDFIHWTEHIAGHVAPGEGNERVRGYLKDVAKATWELVNWLTHAKNAVGTDATLAVEGTGSALFAFGMAIIRKEKGIPDRCPQCASYRMARDWRPEFGPDHEYVSRCEACDWEDLPPGIEPDWEKVPEYIRPGPDGKVGSR